MGIFKKKLKPAPRELDLQFEGQVKRIQFNPHGGFKMTVLVNDATQEWWVPNDPGNRHCQFIRQWICEGGFPEDPDPQPIPKLLGIQMGTWQRTGTVLLIAAAVVTAGAAVVALIM